MSPTIEWTTPEYRNKKRGADWFWAVGIITVSVALSSILLGNMLFAIFIIVAALALSMQVKQEPEIITVRISSRGIEIKNILYTYESIDAFWVENDNVNQQLILRSKKFIVPYIVIPIENINIDTIRQYLSEYIEEVEMQEPLAQRIMERLGF